MRHTMSRSLDIFVGDVSHASKTAKITVFDPVICKTPNVPLQDELILIFMHRIEICAILAYFLSKFGCHGNSLGSLEILYSIFGFADPKNLTIYAKNSSISCT